LQKLGVYIVQLASYGYIFVQEETHNYSTGYFGLGPEVTQPGDATAVLIRCSFPAVLRPHSKFYKVAGECYVHGLMNGEVLGLERAGKCSQRLFMLC